MTNKIEVDEIITKKISFGDTKIQIDEHSLTLQCKNQGGGQGIYLDSILLAQKNADGSIKSGIYFPDDGLTMEIWLNNKLIATLDENSVIG